MIQEADFNDETTASLIARATGLAPTTPLVVPSIQRPFVWPGAKVAKLAESLYLRYPVGYVVLHDDQGQLNNADTPLSDDVGDEADGAHHWIVDGQQRITALCIMAGKSPQWNSALMSEVGYDVVFDPFAETFRKVDHGSKVKAHEVRTREIYDAGEEDDLGGRAATCVDNKKRSDATVEVIGNRLRRVRWALRHSRVGVIKFRGDPIESLEIFKRLNQEGVRVASWDLVVSVGAAKYQDWAVDARNTVAEVATALPGIKVADVLRPFSGVYMPRKKGRASDVQRRFQEVDLDSPKERAQWDSAWDVAKLGWDDLLAVLAGCGLGPRTANSLHYTYFGALVAYLGQRRVLSGNTITSRPDLVDTVRDALVVFLLTHRYRSDEVNSIDKCVGDIQQLRDCGSVEALDVWLQKAATSSARFTKELFLDPYRDGSAQSVALAMFCHGKPDWTKAAEKNTVDCTGEVEAHDIAPTDWLNRDAAPETTAQLAASFANRTFISKSANGSINSDCPAKYIPELSADAVEDHLVDFEVAKTLNGQDWSAVEEFLVNRAERLATRLNNRFFASRAPGAHAK